MKAGANIVRNENALPALDVERAPAGEEIDSFFLGVNFAVGLFRVRRSFDKLIVARPEQRG